jgi:hypothetical protein
MKISVSATLLSGALAVWMAWRGLGVMGPCLPNAGSNSYNNLIVMVWLIHGAIIGSSALIQHGASLSLEVISYFPGLLDICLQSYLYFAHR